MTNALFVSHDEMINTWFHALLLINSYWQYFAMKCIREATNAVSKNANKQTWV